MAIDMEQDIRFIIRVYCYCSLHKTQFIYFGKIYFTLLRLCSTSAEGLLSLGHYV